ncbi:hypothetical protein SAMN05192533_108186 [Mesobacillus persicus]|uniref:Uncharacterized protein n=1 Tax=Mesobacillus persicus TaxID=930146 RepID=A0A1H8DEW4_9BACI|nr:hypothetical protein [Mesobacillus persicus]SEN05645.1 hypothetical protein SAMN05192533_108186 [Mesobacillus persicus]
MDKQMVVSAIVLFILLDLFIFYLFVKYKQGKLDRNPFISIVVKETKIMYYAFFRWKRKKEPVELSFSLVKNSSYFWLFVALMHEQVIEMVFLHIYLKKVDPSYAYIITGLHIYSIFYIMGDYNWVRNTPIRVKDDRIEIKIGARREISFNISDIKQIQRAKLKYNNSEGLVHEKGVFHATAFPRVLTRIFGISDELKHEIIFHHPIHYKGYFGLKKQVDKALIYIEDSQHFVSSLEKKMTSYEVVEC